MMKIFYWMELFFNKITEYILKNKLDIHKY